MRRHRGIRFSDGRLYSFKEWKQTEKGQRCMKALVQAQRYYKMLDEAAALIGSGGQNAEMYIKGVLDLIRKDPTLIFSSEVREFETMLERRLKYIQDCLRAGSVISGGYKSW